MLKPLVKKQLLELNASYFRDRKTGKRRSTGGIIGYILLMVFVLISLASMFFGLGTTISTAFINGTTDWLYFALMGIMTFLLGAFGSVFNTYSHLYQAKDNELLLSMPIKPSDILFSRIIGVYAMSFLYSAIVWVPTIVVYLSVASITDARIILPALLTFIIPLLVSVITCILGWIIAYISSKHKNIITVVLSLLFFAGYYSVCFRMNSIITGMLANAEAIGAAVKGWVFPIYAMAMGASGDITLFLIFLLITLAAFAICYLILSVSFIRIITKKTADSTKAYVEKAYKAKSADLALLKREGKHLLGSPVYLLNTCFGTVITLVVAVVFIVKADALRSMLLSLEGEYSLITRLIPPLAATLACLLASTDAYTAPSISIEGKNLWILRSSPVSAWQILRAKERMHLLLNALPTVIFTVVLGIVAGISTVNIIECCVITVLSIWLNADCGLLLNLKHPLLDWNSETVPVKQSISVLLAIFIGWLTSIVIAVGAFALSMLDMTLYLFIVITAFALALLAVRRTLKSKGTKMFDTL